jgi:putative ABC transport system permease protein
MISRWMDVARLRLRSVFGRERADRELDRELRSHLEAQTDELVARGMSPDEARRFAISTFGGVERIREETRDARGVSMFENIGRDLRYTLRGLRREPMLLIAATISIAVGAGGNLAVFSLAREFMFATPDVRRPEEVVQFQVSHGSHASYQRWEELNQSGALDAIAGFSVEKEINWRNGDVTSSLVPMLVTENFFEVTGVPLVMGRGFSSAESRVALDPRLAVVSHPFWRTRLGGDSSVIGRQLMLNGDMYTIIGVLAPGLRSVVGYSISPGVYLTLNRAIVPELDAPGGIVRLIGRLKPGQTMEQGRVAVDAADRRLGRLAGDTVYAGVQQFAAAGNLAGTNGPKAARMMGGFFTLLGLVSVMVLLIACANVAGLLIARGTRRRQEIAIRLAIGGTRSRLVQQFLVEGFWLALIGTAAGMALSMIFMRLMNSISLPVPMPIELQLAPDPAMFITAVAVVFLCILLCGVLPALSATRLALVPALKREEPFRATRRFTMRGLLLTGQVTVSTVLLVTAFLFIRNLAQTQVADPGFEVDRTLVAQIGFVRGRPDAEQPLLLQRAVERVASLPGVEAAAYSSAVPLTMYSGSSNGRMARIDDRDALQHVEFSRLLVGPGYFSTLDVRLIGGREFALSDAPGSPTVAIVNEEFSRRYFEGRNPVGSRMRFDGENTTYEIVGMVANGKHQTLGEEQRAAMYLPLLQHSSGLGVGFVLTRLKGDPSAAAAPVRQAIGELDGSIAVQVEPMRSALRMALFPSQVGAAILGTLGTLGLILAAFGLYALVAYNVSRRVGEIAIRSALGATRGGILRLVMRDAAVLVGGGVLLGLGLAAFVTAPLSTFLAAGLSSRDPVSFIGTFVVFMTVAALASWWPARQATRVAPVTAMRLD